MASNEESLNQESVDVDEAAGTGPGWAPRPGVAASGATGKARSVGPA